jgi:hypothetical protein
MVWETVFLLVILKIPLVYLCLVVWWAIRAEPAPPEPIEPAHATDPLEPEPRPGWRRRRGAGTPPRPPRRGPHGTPRRPYRRTPLPASWLAAGWKADE